MRVPAVETVCPFRWPRAGVPLRRAAACAGSHLASPATVLAALLALALAATVVPITCRAQPLRDHLPIKERNLDVHRGEANRSPRGEGDQRIVDGWPLYRTPRGQEAFNDAMATLAATEGPAPPPRTFAGCADLCCPLELPRMSSDGWLAPGRIWVSPGEYVVLAHSPRQHARSWHRRGKRGMRIFVFHEFHNSSRNTDPYDTISSHRGEVFVPFYMSKTGTDARGRRYVVVVQIAPHDVVSIHATNRGSAGPGIEVSKNTGESVEPLQVSAGILVATMVKTAVPHLDVVNHRGSEGLDLLRAYEDRLARLDGVRRPALRLPFVPAAPARVATASAHLGALITRPGVSRPLAVAERAFVPPRAAAGPTTASTPRLLGPVTLVRSGREAVAVDPPRLIAPIRPAVRPQPSPGRS